MRAQMNLLLTALEASVGLIIAVTSLFAMNLKQDPDWPGPDPDNPISQACGRMGGPVGVWASECVCVCV